MSTICASIVSLPTAVARIWKGAVKFTDDPITFESTRLGTLSGNVGCHGITGIEVIVNRHGLARDQGLIDIGRAPRHDTIHRHLGKYTAFKLRSTGNMSHLAASVDLQNIADLD
jgi:hypothetical protein